MHVDCTFGGVQVVIAKSRCTERYMMYFFTLLGLILIIINLLTNSSHVALLFIAAQLTFQIT